MTSIVLPQQKDPREPCDVCGGGGKVYWPDDCGRLGSSCADRDRDTGDDMSDETIGILAAQIGAVRDEIARLERDDLARPEWWEWRKRAWRQGVLDAREVAAEHLRKALEFP